MASEPHTRICEKKSKSLFHRQIFVLKQESLGSCHATTSQRRHQKQQMPKEGQHLRRVSRVSFRMMLISKRSLRTSPLVEQL